MVLRILPGFPRGHLPGPPLASLMLIPAIMLIAGLIIAGFAVVGMGIAMVVAKTAPVGYQDEKGFHFGADESSHASETYAFEVPHAKAA